MTKKTTLQKALDKALKNGFDIRKTNVDSLSSSLPYEMFIYSHFFAKAFWGENTCKERKITIFGEDDRYHDGYLERIPNWQFHLQQIVLEEEPLKYLKKFL